MKIWFLITEETRQGLIAYQNKYYPMIPLTPPVDDEEPARFDFKLEDTEEIGKLIGQTRRHFKGGGSRG
jgi:hypothetical protein